MTFTTRTGLHFLAASTAALLTATPVLAELSAEELAKLAQNPVGNLVSVPFQNNTNLNFGPEKGTQNVLNIQPVVPISVNNDWNIKRVHKLIMMSNVYQMSSLTPKPTPKTGEGNLFEYCAFLLFGERSSHIGIDEAGCDGVAVDVAGGKLPSDRLGESDQSRL